MKKIILLMIVASVSFTWIYCSNANARYIDLQTGKTVKLEKDPQTGLLVASETKQAPYLYVDSKHNDTIYGKTGNVVNGHIRVTADNRYWYDADLEESMTQGGEYKIKADKDEIKIKTDDKKVVIDRKTGEKKVKDK